MTCSKPTLGAFSGDPHRSPGARPRRAEAAWRVAAALAVLAIAGLGAVGPGVAGAAVTHSYLSGPSQALSAGVPGGCVVSPAPPLSEPPCISGAFGNIGTLAVAGGRVWVGDSPHGHGRIDGFESSSPWGFASPQLDEEGGVSELGGQEIAVDTTGAEQLVFSVALHPHEENEKHGFVPGYGIVAAYGESSGKLAGVWTGANTLTKSFTQEAGTEVAVMEGVAVDDSTNPLSTGDVYVETGAGHKQAYKVVDVFAAGTAGGETALVGTLRGTCATVGTSCPGTEVPFTEPKTIAVSPANGDVFVVDMLEGAGAGERVDVFEPLGSGAFKFLRELTGPPAGKFREISAMAVDPKSGELYVADRLAEAGTGIVYQFSEAGTFEGRITGVSSSEPFASVRGVGVNGSGEVFVGEAGSSRVDVFGPDVVIPDVETSPAKTMVDGEGHVSAELNGEVDPDDAGDVVACPFAWGQSQAFGSAVECEPRPANGSAPVKVHGLLEGLAPDTTYWFRLQAANGNGLNQGEEWQDHSFHTPGPGIGEAGGTDVTSSSVTFEGVVDPNGAPTVAYFQYTPLGSTAGCGSGAGKCATAPAGGGEALGAGSGAVQARANAQGLTAGTTYHYRIVAVSTLEVRPGVKEDVSFYGPDEAFTTAVAANGDSGLLDDRQWELVTPPDEHGGLIDHPGLAALEKSSASGEAMTYLTTIPAESGVAGFPEAVQVLATRAAAGGWSDHDISPPHSQPTGSNVGEGPEYRGFSEDLCDAVVEPRGPFTSLTPEAFPPDTERTPYLRHDCSCGGEPAGCFAPVATGAPGYADVAEGTAFGEESNGLPTGGVAYVGGSPDMKHVIVRSALALTGGAATPGDAQLFEWSAEKPAGERLTLVSIGEHGQPAASPPFLGYEEDPGAEADSRGAVSADGSLVFWAESGGGLYVTDTVSGVSRRLDVKQGGSGAGPAQPVFQGASANGTANGDRVFFTDTQRLTEDSLAGPGKPDLYSCEIVVEAGGPRCELSDLTPGNGGEAGDALNLVSGISEDGSWVYFAANGVLGATAGEGAKPGGCAGATAPAGQTCNLYVEHYEEDVGWAAPRLVAVLSSADFPDWEGSDPADMTEITARVSSNGLWFVFMSDRSLTGYDNLDATSEQPDEEVFEYHVEGGAGRLACVSCDPSGARPEGVEYASIREGVAGGNEDVWKNDQWLAATVPGYEPYHQSKAQYQPRFLSDEGRVFFDAPGALVPGDVNGKMDVYEWEPPGLGSCAEGSESFVGGSGGCLGLVSSGRAAGESVFVDASESGDDVFFLSDESLVRAATGTALELYDAHACSPSAPCTAEAQEPPACSTVDACRAAPTPQPSVFGAPASATLSGPGNAAAGSPPSSAGAGSKAARPSAPSRAQLLARALKACKKDRARRRRVACEAAARKRYGPVKNDSRGHKARVSGVGASGERG